MSATTKGSQNWFDANFGESINGINKGINSSKNNSGNWKNSS